jgi:hypothetical protein
VQEDPARTIYGVDARVLVTPETSTPLTEFNKITFLVEQNGAIELESWSMSPEVSDFQRQSTVGASTTATLHCSGPGATDQNKTAVTFSTCANGTIPVTFTLAKIETLY